MGIINITPDSFSGDGLAGNVPAIVEQARAMVGAGADILDVGGESARPGAQPISLDEELARIIPAIEQLIRAVGVPISVDTSKGAVATAALLAGAHIVNDIGGLQGDSTIAAVAAQYGAPVIAMHMQGQPATMQVAPQYVDLIGEICGFLRRSVAIGMAAGIARDQIILDPGFGFGKTVEHNLEILRSLATFKALGQPLLIGTSRKGTIGHVLSLPVAERLEGSLATAVLAVAQGADIVRVHDVPATVRAVRMADAVVRGTSAEY